MLNLAIETDNEATMLNVEVALLLEITARRIRNGRFSGSIIDSNGNTVGHYKLTGVESYTSTSIVED